MDDLDGGGVDDFAVSAPSKGLGAVYLISGASMHVMDIVEPEGTHFGMGTVLARIEDLSGDSLPDLPMGGIDFSLACFDTNAFLYSSYDQVGVGGCFPTVPNSAGYFAVSRATGSNFASVNELKLRAEGLPSNRFGYFLVGSQPGTSPIANSLGILCITGMIGRYNRLASQILTTGSSNFFELDIDLAALPIGTGTPALAGQTWHFQAWYRDNNPGPTSNFTSRTSVTFQ